MSDPWSLDNDDFKKMRRMMREVDDHLDRALHIHEKWERSAALVEQEKRAKAIRRSRTVAAVCFTIAFIMIVRSGLNGQWIGAIINGILLVFAIWFLLWAWRKTASNSTLDGTSEARALSMAYDKPRGLDMSDIKRELSKSPPKRKHFPNAR
jgi:hypothetical protein